MKRTLKYLGRSTAVKFKSYKIYFINSSVCISWETTFSFTDVQSYEVNIIHQIEIIFSAFWVFCKMKVFLLRSLLSMIIGSLGHWVRGQNEFKNSPLFYAKVLRNSFFAVFTFWNFLWTCYYQTSSLAGILTW